MKMQIIDNLDNWIELGEIRNELEFAKRYIK